MYFDLFSTIPFSPWNGLQPSDFSQLCCRRVHLTLGRFQWQLRDYTKNLIDATEVTVTGPFALATRRSDDPRCQRDCHVDLGPSWKPATVQVIRFVAPTKFYYELMAGEILFIYMNPNQEFIIKNPIPYFLQM